MLESNPIVGACGSLQEPDLFRLDGVSVKVGARTLLQPMDLRLGEGRIYGLIGHNGSGKSTLLKLLARQQSASTGSLQLGDKPLHGWSSRAFARQIGYLPQQPPEVDGLLVRELVALGRHPWHGALGRFGAEDRDQVEQAMLATDVAQYAERPVDSLSGGERQRAWIAMLVAQNCRCMLLDEPTSALDIGHQLAVLELLRNLCGQRGMGAVIILHDVNMAARFCDEVIALREGCLQLQIQAREMLQEAHLERVYGVPMGVVADPASGRLIGFAR
ncbi:ATP-binding cassette domain-containing protein [Pseudomonas gingeri]|uniref:ATP-binding cassette domain-containing protein n=3 Tax=Pseudomonas TaxID=286 RepID=A0A7Y8CC85_9PSED|nr:ATP-binding cassette domain-containing protein [Pseudomonas gingeri]NWC13423.1 ATP-binding cassette domain-containing protein [Pseudomonas gingeri]NWE45160.1 ATP-binding cassette domain-containing protein [Pseudomonas gingeri]